MKKRPRFLILFYLLVGYVLLQFFWWAYLLITLSTELIQSQAVTNGYTQEVALSLSKNKTWMILGEGSVFIILLALGLYQIRKSIVREVSFAQQQQNFMMAVTHELKSPLAAIKLQLQTILKRKSLSEEQKNKLLTQAALDTDRLTALTEKILTATSVEQAKLKLAVEKIHLLEFVTNTIQTYQENNGLLFQIQIPAHFTVKADRIALNSVLVNLIENSLKYADTSKEIAMIAELKNNKLHLYFQDVGTGFQKVNTNLIFKPFYRGGNELTRKAKGTGLGLYIVKHLLIQMGGNIQVNTAYKKGASLLITLPAY